MDEELVDLTLPTDPGHLIHMLVTNVVSAQEASFRELVQNAMGADARNIHFWVGQSPFGEGPDDVCCHDDGGGMDADEIKRYLLTLTEGTNRYGKFGIGFLSIFALTERATVITTKGRDPKTKTVTGLRVDLTRVTNHEGRQPSTHISGPKQVIGEEELGQYGFLGADDNTKSCGTKIVLRSPVLQQGGNSSKLAQSPAMVKGQLEKWCRYIDPSVIKVYFHGEVVNHGLQLVGETQVRFSRTVRVFVAGSRFQRERSVNGIVTFSPSPRVDLLQNGIYVCMLSQVPNAQNLHNGLPLISASIDCELFDINAPRNNVAFDDVVSKCMEALSAVIAEELEPALVTKFKTNSPLTKEEVAYVRHRVIQAINSGEDFAKSQALQVFTGVPLFGTIPSEATATISVKDLTSLPTGRKRIYYASSRDSIAEEVARRGYYVLVQYGNHSAPAPQLLAPFLEQYGIELVDTSTLKDSKRCVIAEDSALGIAETRFLEGCRCLDSAIYLGNIYDWDDKDITSDEGFYVAAGTEHRGAIVLNRKARQVEVAIGSTDDLAWLLVLPIIVHERAHEKVRGHTVQFYQELERVLEEKARVLPGIIRKLKSEGATSAATAAGDSIDPVSSERA